MSSKIIFSFILEASQSIDDDEYEPFYPSEKLQIPYGMDIVRSLNFTLQSIDSIFFLARIDKITCCH